MKIPALLWLEQLPDIQSGGTLYFSWQICGPSKYSIGIDVANDLSVLLRGRGKEVVEIASFSLAEAFSNRQ